MINKLVVNFAFFNISRGEDYYIRDKNILELNPIQTQTM